MSVLAEQLEWSLKILSWIGKDSANDSAWDDIYTERYNAALANLNAALVEAVANEALLCSVILIKDKARLPLTTKSEVIENLQELIAEQAPSGKE